MTDPVRDLRDLLPRLVVFVAVVRHGSFRAAADELGLSRSVVSTDIAKLEDRLGVELGEGWDRKYEPWYRTAFERELVAVDGVVEALDELRLPHCVASSGSHAKMRRTLGQTGLWHRFEGRIFSATEVANGKPAPDLFLHAAGRLGTAPERCAVVEDSAHGVQAARSAGMHVFAYAGGVTPAERLEGPGTTVFSDMRQLPGLIQAGRP